MVGEGVTVVEIGAVAAMDVVVVKTIALHFFFEKKVIFSGTVPHCTRLKRLENINSLERTKTRTRLLS